MDDTVAKIIIAVVGALLGSGGLWAVIQRRTPDAGQQQLSRDAFYATLDARERAAQQQLRDREDYWRGALQQAQQECNARIEQRDRRIDDLERAGALTAAELKAAQDRIEWLQQRLAAAMLEADYFRKKVQGG